MEDTKPEEEWDDSLNDMIFGTANYKAPEEQVTKATLEFDTSTPMGVYNAINHKQKVTLTFPDKKTAEQYRVRLAQIKHRKDKYNESIGFFETDSLLFRRLKDQEGCVIEISLGRRETRNYGFVVNSITEA